MISPKHMERHGWTAVRALPYLEPDAKNQLREAVKAYMANASKQLDSTPFSAPPSLGTLGGSGAVVDMAIRMYFLHKAFPDLVSPEYTLRAVNHILGTHPVSSTSYVSGVGTVSKLKMYSNNRADNAYIPGAVSRVTSLSSRISPSASMTSGSCGLRMKPSWRGQRAGWWRATPRLRLPRGKVRLDSTEAGAACTTKPLKSRCNLTYDIDGSRVCYDNACVSYEEAWMSTIEKNSKPERDNSQESKDGSTEPAAGTETALKGGAEPAKRQAEHDWENSSKESGE